MSDSARPPCFRALYFDLLRPASVVGPRAWLAFSRLIRLRSSAESGLSRTLDEVATFPSWSDRESPGKRGPVPWLAILDHRESGRTRASWRLYPVRMDRVVSLN